MNIQELWIVEEDFNVILNKKEKMDGLTQQEIIDLILC